MSVHNVIVIIVMLGKGIIIHNIHTHIHNVIVIIVMLGKVIIVHNIHTHMYSCAYCSRSRADNVQL